MPDGMRTRGRRFGYVGGTYLECGIVVDRKGFRRLAGRSTRGCGRRGLSGSGQRRAGPHRPPSVRGLRKRGGHRAQLNFGDCFAYALAVERDEPLLFKGMTLSIPNTVCAAMTAV